VTTEPDLMEVCKKLIDMANEGGGPDNITVVAARFEGDGLVERDAETVEHRVYRGSDARPTMPIDRASIPQLSAIDERDIPTLEMAPVKPQGAMVVGNAGDGPTTEIAPAQIRATLPPTPPPGGWIPAKTLQLFFGFITVLVAGVVLLKWLRG
jgi:hypothetical protein